MAALFLGRAADIADRAPNGALIAQRRPYRESFPEAKASDGQAQGPKARYNSGTERAVHAFGRQTMPVPFDQRPDLIWLDGKLIPTADCKISVLTHGLHYASTVFEGERAYGGQIFRSVEHSERLKRSAQLMDFEIPFSVAEIEAAKQLVLDRNGQKEAYVRAIAWRGSEQLGVSAQNNKIHLAIATWEWPSYFDPAQRLKGIRLDLAEYRRPDPKTAPCLAKAAGLANRASSRRHSRASRRGVWRWCRSCTGPPPWPGMARSSGRAGDIRQGRA